MLSSRARTILLRLIPFDPILCREGFWPTFAQLYAVQLHEVAKGLDSGSCGIPDNVRERDHADNYSRRSEVSSSGRFQFRRELEVRRPLCAWSSRSGQG